MNWAAFFLANLGLVNISSQLIILPIATFLLSSFPYPIPFPGVVDGTRSADVFLRIAECLNY